MNIFGVQLSEKIYLPIFIILIALIFNVILKIFINNWIKVNTRLSKHEQRSRRTVILLVENIFKVIIIIAAILAILQVFGINTSALVAGVGAVSLVVGLAFQDMLKDFLVGASIIFESQFAIGEIVTINGYKGEVISLTLKTTRIKCYTGEVVIISNRTISTVVNHSLSDSLVVVDLSVAYSSNLDKVEKALDELCKVLKDKIPEIKGDIIIDGIDALDDSAIIYRISARASAKNIVMIKRKILKEAKLIFDKNKIEIPFPQVEVHHEK
jgi:small conductance mechanosensitive channel